MATEQKLAPGFINAQTLRVLDGDFEIVKLYDQTREEHFYFFHDNQKDKRYVVTEDMYDSLWNLLNEC